MKIFIKLQSFIFRIVLSLLCVALANCATIISGTSQGVYIDTPQVHNASCNLKDKNGETYHLEQSPGNVTVQKGNGPLSIVCGKAGYETGTTVVESSFSDAALGNILMPGGTIGMLIDAVSGAAEQYPKSILVWMKPFQWSSQSQKNEWLKRRNEYYKALKDKEKLKSIDYEEE